MTEHLRSALNECPSIRAVARETGLRHNSLALFARGEQSLRLDLADRLAEYFGIRCIRTQTTHRSGRKN